MGQPRYRGPVETVEQAMWANRVLTITCQRCSGSRSMWAYKLFHLRSHAGAMPLHTAVGGFYCRGCRAKVQVVMVPDGPW
ncbi:MAG: hypothetical protein V4527_12170 [Pseudomonadota bacterium]